MRYLSINFNHIAASEPDKLERLYYLFWAAEKAGEAWTLNDGFFAPIVCFDCLNSPSSAMELYDSLVLMGVPKPTLKLTAKKPLHSPFSKRTQLKRA